MLVLLDSVQWIRQGRQHRVRVLPHRSANRSEFQWITIPVRGKGHRSKQIQEIEVDLTSRKWAHAHWNTLAAIYGRRPYFKSQLEPIVRPWLENEAPSLATLYDVAFGSMRICLEALGIRPEIVRSSHLPEQGTKSERLISLCKVFDGETYYSGIGSTRYLDIAAFRAAGIRVLWQHWKHPEYEQGTGQRFKSHLSVLDALANAPIETLQHWLEPQPWGPFGETEP